MKRKIFRLLLLAPLVSIFALTSCIREEVIDHPTPTGDATVTFSLRVPGNSTPDTRSMDDVAEYKVNTIEVVAFKDGKFSYWTSAAANLKSGNNTYEAILKLVQGTGYDLVVFANSKGIISEASSSMVKGTTTKDATLSLFTKNITGKWNAAMVGSEAFPMSSDPELAALMGKTIDENTTFSTIDLYRMTARVQVNLKAGVESKFELEEVWVYNRNKTGYVTGKHNPVTVNAYTSREIPVTGNDATKLIYKDSEVSATACEREIYLFEVANPNPASSKSSNERPCLVVGGTYNGKHGYYRVDFHDGTEYLNVLRNHSYNITITDVTGIGFEDPDDAFAAGPENIVVRIVGWNETGIGDIVFDGQFLLAIRPSSEFDFFKPADTQTAEIKTTYPGGWKVLKITEADGVTPPSNDWLTTDKNTGTLYGADGNFTSLDISVSENNSGGDRTGYIYIKAGKLETRLTVTQSNVVPLSVNTTVNGIPATEVVFSNNEIGSKILGVSWFPRDAGLIVAISSVSEDTAFAGTGVPTTGTISDVSGTKSYTISATAFTQEEINANPFLEKVSKVDFTVSSGGSYAAKSVFLRHVNFNTVADVDDYYMLNGGTYSFDVRSNTVWMVSVLTGDISILNQTETPIIGQSGGYDISGGQSIDFTLVDDQSSDMNGKTVTLTLTDPTHQMSDIYVTIKGATCGINGVAVAQHIGTNGNDNPGKSGKTYLTHMYGNKCWMVQNSMEGTASATMYNNVTSQVNGYYYTWVQASTANNACPRGWHLPSEIEFIDLIKLVYNGNVNNLTAPHAKWWAGPNGANNGAFAGYFTVGHGWNYWDAYGNWWQSSKDRSFQGGPSSMSESVNQTHWFSVRCVQDQ